MKDTKTKLSGSIWNGQNIHIKNEMDRFPVRRIMGNDYRIPATTDFKFSN